MSSHAWHLISRACLPVLPFLTLEDLQVSNASILDAEQVKGKDGKEHYNLHVLTRSGKSQQM